MRTRTPTAAAAILALAAGVSAACPTPVKLTMSDAQSPDFAGAALSMSPTPSNGVSLMVGAGSDDTSDGLNAGSVYTFARVNGIWGQVGHFFANDGQPSDFFGVSVGYADPYAVIGATGVGNTGAAYFFERFGSSWQQVGKVFPAANEGGADMGRSVDIHALDAIVGAPLKDVDMGNVTYSNNGEAYIYRRTAAGWTLVYTIPWVPQMFGDLGGDHLGAAVAIGHDLAFAGAPYGEYAGSANDVGYLQVHRRDVAVWSYQRRIDNPWAAQGDHFGASVTTDGTFLAAGAPDDDLEAAEHPINAARTDSGCVVIYRWDLANEDWYLDGRVFAGDPSDAAKFGSSVVLRNGRLIVGAEGTRKAYVFRRDGASNWVQEAALTDPDSAFNGNFGCAVASDGTHVACGDYGDDHNGLTNAGAVYVATQPGFGQGGDLCSAPTEIPGHGEYTGCTALATLGGATTCGGLQQFQGADVWYSWTPTCTGNAIIDTIGSDFDTVLSIHSGCPGSGANTIVCNDDAGGIFGTASLLTFDYSAGTTYLIRIAGYNLASGDYTLRVWEGVAPSNDDCTSPAPVTNGTHTLATCMATTAGPAINGCNGQNLVAGHDVWFRYSAACTGIVTVDLCGSNYDTVVGVYLGTGCPSQPGTAIVCSDDSDACGDDALTSRVSFPTVQGFQYTIRVGGFQNDAYGTAVMNISCAPNCPADWNGNGTVNSSDISAFLTSWLASVQGGNLNADFNHDQVTNSTDISAFLTAWLQAVQQGC